MKIGLFGGTFDPPHAGHLIVAQDALVALGLDGVLFVPAAIPPHKLGRSVSPAADRARMLELAIDGDARFGMDPIELRRSGPSFTIDTVRELMAREPSARWTLLIGADQYADFEAWREPAELRRLARVGVLTRRGTHGRGAEDALAPQVRIPGVSTLPNGDVRVDVTRVDISATAVRRRAAAGLSIRYLVPAAVETYISEHRLYGRNGIQVTGYDSGSP